MYFVGQVLYYQLNIDYIIETYCVNKEKPELQCNGKCHLVKQLQVSASNTQSDRNPAIILIIEAFFPLYIESTTSATDISIISIFSKTQWFLEPSKTKSYIDELFHPPRQLV